MTQCFTAIIEREDDSYVALYPELDIASQGESASEAGDNLREAIELFLESASRDEIQRRCSVKSWSEQKECQRTIHHVTRRDR